jgi:hypothetical protein
LARPLATKAIEDVPSLFARKTVPLLKVFDESFRFYAPLAVLSTKPFDPGADGRLLWLQTGGSTGPRVAFCRGARGAPPFNFILQPFHGKLEGIVRPLHQYVHANVAEQVVKADVGHHSLKLRGNRLPLVGLECTSSLGANETPITTAEPSPLFLVFIPI